LNPSSTHTSFGKQHTTNNKTPFGSTHNTFTELQYTRDDTNQVNKEMTKDEEYHSYYENSSQQSSENLTKDLADLTKGRNGHKPESDMVLFMAYNCGGVCPCGV